MTILLHSFLACTFLTRSSLSLAIVAMTNSSTTSNPDVPVSLNKLCIDEIVL